jgi:hypothetical protein
MTGVGGQKAPWGTRAIDPQPPAHGTLGRRFITRSAVQIQLPRVLRNQRDPRCIFLRYSSPPCVVVDTPTTIELDIPEFTRFHE